MVLLPMATSEENDRIAVQSKAQMTREDPTCETIYNFGWASKKNSSFNSMMIQWSECAWNCFMV